MAKIELEGHLIGISEIDDDGDEIIELEIDEVNLGWLMRQNLKILAYARACWDLDYGRVRITIEQLEDEDG